MPDYEIKHYYIVKENPFMILRKCKRHSKGTLAGFLVGICALYIIMNWIPELLGLVLPTTNIDLMMQYAPVENRAVLQKLPGTPVVMYIYGALFGGAFRLGECLYTLTYIRNKKAEPGALSEGFSLYGKVLGLYLIQTLIIGFWAMFFIIPGIIAALNFSQTFYILADDPKKGITQVLTESKLMMLGNRIAYIRTLIAFLPYVIISYAPAMAVSYLITADSVSKLIYTAIALAVELPVFASYGFMDLGKCTFYELLINKGFAHFKYAGQDAFREAE
jgi:uncharacterized membrane protein